MIFRNDSVIAVFSRKPANMSFAHGACCQDALIHREKFLSGIGINYRDVICAKQVHGDSVAVVGKSDIGKGAESSDSAITDTDAFITNIRNLPVAVLTADCLSVFLYDSQNSAVGIVHAGWKGTAKNITAKTLDLMRGKFGTNPLYVQAGLGPAIRACCYEVGEEFKGYFNKGITQHNGKYYLDLAAINTDQLLGFGVRKENIEDPVICTSCRKDEFFSYRREQGSCGRIMSVIMLK